MDHQLYRRSTLGQSLLATLDELKDKLPSELRDDILDQFDMSMKEALSNIVTNRVQISGKIDSSRHVSDVYMILVQDCKVVFNGLKVQECDYCKLVIVGKDKEEKKE